MTFPNKFERILKRNLFAIIFKYRFVSMKVKDSVSLSVEVTATDEEKKWIKELATGKAAKVIAKELKMPEGTFAYKLNLLRERFQCKNTSSLIVYFFQNKLID